MAKAFELHASRIEKALLIQNITIISAFSIARAFKLHALLIAKSTFNIKLLQK